MGAKAYGDRAMQMIRTEVPSLDWLLPASTTEAPANSPQWVPQLKADLVQQLGPAITGLRRGVEQLTGTVEQLIAKVEQLAARQDQLAVRQDQMAKNIETMQMTEQEISQKLASRAAGSHKLQKPAARSSAGQSSPVDLAPPKR